MLVTVFVMNDLVSAKCAAEAAGHDKTVFVTPHASPRVRGHLRERIISID